MCRSAQSLEPSPKAVSTLQRPLRQVRSGTGVSPVPLDICVYRHSENS